MNAVSNAVSQNELTSKDIIKFRDYSKIKVCPRIYAPTCNWIAISIDNSMS